LLSIEILLSDRKSFTPLGALKVQRFFLHGNKEAQNPILKRKFAALK